MSETPSCRDLDIRMRTLENNHTAIVGEIKGIRESLERLEKMFEEIITKIEANYVTKDQLALYTKDQKYGKVIAGLTGAIITFVILGAVGIFFPEIAS